MINFVQSVDLISILLLNVNYSVGAWKNHYWKRKRNSKEKLYPHFELKNNGFYWVKTNELNAKLFNLFVHMPARSLKSSLGELFVLTMYFGTIIVAQLHQVKKTQKPRRFYTDFTLLVEKVF